MCKIICVSNRHLCDTDFVQRLKEISKMDIPIILREKDLSESEYEKLAKRVLSECDNVILHTFIDVAKKLKTNSIHLPINMLKTEDVRGFEKIGASVHSVEEAVEAQILGASYITAGHIFATDCKKELKPRGLDFLESVCRSVSIPVYAIGGINSSNMKSAVKRGAAGVCIMSGFMKN